MTLYHVFSEFLEDISEDTLPNEATGFKQSKIWNKLYDFQKDAVLAMDIPYHIIFVLEYNGLCQAWTAYKEKTSGGNKAFKGEKYYHTEWLSEDDLVLKLDGLNMDSVYESYVRQIAGDTLINASANVSETLKESVERDKKIQMLNKQIENLQTKIRREKQFNRQIELNAELKKKKKEKEVLTSCN